MAEYYPLLDRAVSGLTAQTAEARRSIYERARAALIGQLRRMEPPIPEEDITRESTALDEAIARVESRFESGPDAVDAGPVRRESSPPEAKREMSGKRDETAPPASPPPRPPAATSVRVAPPRLPTGAPPVVPPPSRERPVVGQRSAPALETPSPRVPPQRAANTPPPSRGTRPVMALRPVAPVPPAGTQDAGGLPAAGGLAPSTRTFGDPAVAAASASPETRIETPRTSDGFADALDDAARRTGEVHGVRARETSLRPPAPRPPQARRLGWRAALVTLLGVIVVAIGIAAYRMRDRPEQVVATRSDAGSTQVDSPDKSAERASSAASDTGDAPEATSGAAVPAPVGQNGPDAAPASPSIAVAQRAALLVDAPEDPKRVKTYLGTVVWHLDSVSPGQGQPLATAVKADIDIPEAKLKVTMLMQKNPEPQLPASHTIEFHFLPQAGNTLGNVKQINVPEMRRDDDAPTGDPLAGVPVAITDNYFLVGLGRGAPETQNMRLVGDRNWFDVGFLFTSGKLGKLTFEKGGAGQHTFDDALKAWH